MKTLAHRLKKYDKFLNVRKLLDGTLVVYRQSPFSHLQFDVLTIHNKYLGSCNWIMKRISQMDQQRHDIHGDVEKSNKEIRSEKKDSRVSRELADFMLKDQIVIN